MPSTGIFWYLKGAIKNIKLLFYDTKQTLKDKIVQKSVQKFNPNMEGLYVP